MEGTKLTLYVAGDSARASGARQCLERLSSELLQGRAEIEVVDLQDPAGRARADRVYLTPTLVLGDPRRGARVFGDLSDPHLVACGLGLLV